MRSYAYTECGLLLLCIAGCSHKLPGNTNDVTELSVQMAREIRETSLSQCALELNGLKSLSPEAADIISTHSGPIELNGLTTLSVALANSLAKHSAGNLTLNGIRDLDVECAAALSRHRGGLVLNGLASLTAGVAKALTRGAGSLTLNGLKTIPVDIAQALSKQTNWLYLDGVASLVPEAAEALAVQNSMLSFASLTQLTPDVAKALAKQKGTMLLNGVTEVSDEVTTLLAAHQNQGIGLVMQNASRQQKRIASIASGNSAVPAGITQSSSSSTIKATGSPVASAVSQQSQHAAVQQTKASDAGAKKEEYLPRDQILRKYADAAAEAVNDYHLKVGSLLRSHGVQASGRSMYDELYAAAYAHLDNKTVGLQGQELGEKAKKVVLEWSTTQMVGRPEDVNRKR